MLPGQEPFGKAAFAARNHDLKDAQIEASSDIREIKVLGDWAWMRNFLDVKIKTSTQQTVEQSGFVLTILRKLPERNWVIARDANLLTPKVSDARPGLS